jgi:hypothetical protein
MPIAGRGLRAATLGLLSAFLALPAAALRAAAATCASALLAAALRPFRSAMGLFYPRPFRSFKDDP